jgi:hypothetical protein
VGWWHAENDYRDEFGVDNGASAGAASFIPGVVGHAFNLTGAANSFVTIPDSSAVDLTTAITMEAWINPTALGGRIIDKITANGTDGYMLDTNGGKLRMIIGGTALTSAATLSTGTWTQVAGVYDGATMTIYINGVAAGTVAHTGAIPTNTHSLRIGADSVGANLFDGAIDEVRIFNRAMTAGQMTTLFAAGQARATQGAGQMVGWYSGDVSIAPAVDVLQMNNGAAGTGVTLRAGILASAQAFPGSAGAFTTIPDSVSLEVSTTVTMEAWIDATALGGRIFDKITAGGINGYLLDTNGGKLRAIIGNTAVLSTNALATGSWTHVAGVYDGANVTVYVNGAVAGMGAHTGFIPTNSLTLRLGADSAGGSLFTGVIDEARIYNRALPAADILALYDESLCQ